MEINVETIAGIIAAAGGWSALRWWLDRRNERRVSAARAASEEFKALKEYNDFLQSSLLAKEKCFAEQTAVLRRANANMIEAEKAIGKLGVELVRVRCDRLGCPHRQPPNAFTPPVNDVSDAMPDTPSAGDRDVIANKK